MNRDEALKALEAAGTAQNRKVYAQHGVGERQYGVSWANLKAMAKKIKTDHALAEQLWESGNHDARILALMIADPNAAPARQIDQWAKELSNYVITDAFAGFVARTPHARAKGEKWAASKDEWLGSAGWTILGHLEMNDAESPDEYFEKKLATIEREIHTRKNRVRHAMNQALICIGTRNPRLTQLAIAAAERIGVVAVDHGETNCKTPDAVGYIRKVLAHKKKSG